MYFEQPVECLLDWCGMTAERSAVHCFTLTCR